MAVAYNDGEAKGPLGSDIGDPDIVAECKENFQLCLDTEDRTEALDDLKFKKGGDWQWDAEAIAQRDLDNRPHLTYNDVPAILHQVTNDARQNKQSIHVAPVDDKADPEIAEVLGGLIRHIEYDSDADAAYDTALSNAADIGFGYFRLITEYSDPMSFNQDAKIKRIRNPFTVYTDPNAQEADGSDMRWAIIASKVPRKQFERENPGVDCSADGIGSGPGDNANWVGKEYVRVAEYYRIEETPHTLLLLRSGETVLEGEGTAALDIVAKRPTALRKVMWYKLSAFDVIEQSEVPCDTIPVFPVYGDEIDEDGFVTRYGIIRNLKDPARMNNYWLTSATEEVALRTKTPFIGALGQFEGLEADWNAANTRNFSYLEYNPVSIDGTIAPPPQRQPPADVPTGQIQMMMMARDAKKAVTGIYDASLGARSNEVSGLAIRARQQQGDIANFHFTDNLTRAISRMAKCLIQMIPRIYDTDRIVRILGEDRRTAEHVKINHPEMKQTEDGAIETILNDLTVGKYDVTVSTGPAYNTLREETVSNMVEVGGKWPELFEVAGADLVKAMDWPQAQKIGALLTKYRDMKFPALAEHDDEEQPMVQGPNGPIPIEQAGQLLTQLDQTVQAMDAEMEEMKSGIAKAKLDNESKERIAAANNDAKLDVEELKGMITLLQQNIAPIIAHQAAVVAAADPEHPDAPADIAQGMEAPPAEAEAAERAHEQNMEAQEASRPEPDAG